MRNILLTVFLFGPLVHAANFDGGHHAGTVTSHLITEASGICASRTHRDVLYTHNDSGDTHRIFAISATSGARLGTIYINGAHSQDWEDIACGPCTGGSGNCVYIGDTGGNAGGDANTIYRIREPSSIHDQSVNVDGVLEFSWDQHDCETLLVDPRGEVYVVSKVGPGHHGKFVHLPASAWNQHHHVWVNDGVYLPITASSNSPVGGDISPSGTELLLKTYGHVYYWSIPDQNYEAHIHNYPQSLPYHAERQGEAVCWKVDGSGFYTLSEGANSVLYFHRRL